MAMSFSAHEKERDGSDRSSPETLHVVPLRPPTRLLVWLTTSPWRNNPPLTIPVAHHLSVLKSRGWLLRQATPRNFVVWRGEILRGHSWPLIVLPNREVRLTTVERSAIAVCLAAPALFRIAGNPASDEDTENADRFASQLGFCGGTHELAAYLASANRKIHAALAPPWAGIINERY